eukprot:456509_1
MENDSPFQLLLDCTKYSWSQFRDSNLKILGIGTDFIVLMAEKERYCIRIALLDDDYNDSKRLNLEAIRLRILFNYISQHHQWIVPVYNNIKDIYLPSASKPRIKSTIYKSIGSKTVWDLGQSLIPFIQCQFDQIGQFLAVLHSFDYVEGNNNINNMQIPIITAKQRLLKLINRISMDRIMVIKQSNILSVGIFNQCIDFIKYCKDNIIGNDGGMDIFGFSDGEDYKSDSVWNKYCFIHSDLHTAHFIVDDNNNKNINGIIDWSDIQITDIASEFRYLWTMFGDECLVKSNYCKYRLQKIKTNVSVSDSASKQFYQRCRVYGILCSFLSLYWCLESQTDDEWRSNITTKLIKKDLKLINKYIAFFND